MLYSKATGGFYDRSVHGESVPDDVVEVVLHDYIALFEGQANGKQIIADDNGYPVLSDIPPVSESDRREFTKEQIDTAAGMARNRFVSPGTLIDAEYLQAESAARSYADSNYSGEVPSSIQSWSDATGMTAEVAADDILATAQQWRNVLDQIRAIRLSGKAAVEAAPDGNIEATAKLYIDQLNALQP